MYCSCFALFCSSHKRPFGSEKNKGNSTSAAKHPPLILLNIQKQINSFTYFVLPDSTGLTHPPTHWLVPQWMVAKQWNGMKLQSKKLFPPLFPLPPRGRLEVVGSIIVLRVNLRAIQWSNLHFGSTHTQSHTNGRYNNQLRTMRCKYEIVSLRLEYQTTLGRSWGGGGGQDHLVGRWWCVEGQWGKTKAFTLPLRGLARAAAAFQHIEWGE